MWLTALCALLLLLLLQPQTHGKRYKVATGPDADKAAETYRRLKPCLRYDREYVLKYPWDAEDHYSELLKRTDQYRNQPVHRGSANYNGTWIEDQFIARFLTMPLSHFSGLFPLFVQWSDYGFAARARGLTQAQAFEPLRAFLRPDVLYVTVSQANNGLEFLHIGDPNVIVLSAGGDGNIPIPLIKGTLPYSPPPESFSVQMGFYGSPEHGPRGKIIAEMDSAAKAEVPSWVYFVGPHKHWKEQMGVTTFNLAPRGFGRASFRLAEIIQLGRIPVYLYDDAPWAPYERSPFGVEHVGYQGQLGRLAALVRHLKAQSNATVFDKLARVAAARRYYTLDGTLDQIDLFLRDPLGPAGGHLTCRKHAFITHGKASVLDINL